MKREMSVSVDHKISEISDFIRNAMGLYFPPQKFKELRYKLTELSRDRGFKNTDDYINTILKDKNNSQAIEQLAAKLTIGETYYWRDRDLFRALESIILPELIESKRNGNKTIRIWSAGCSSGEEPYSIAILLKRLIPDISQWNISINATDINPISLKKAIEAKYTEWSFRSAPHWLKEDYFVKIDKNTYQLDKSIRQMVKFSHLNFSTDIYPSLSNDTNSKDIIFCRNVFIYFALDDIKNISDRLYNCLAKTGMLITSPSESFQYLSSRFKQAFHKNVTVYQRADSEESINEKPEKKARHLMLDNPTNLDELKIKRRMNGSIRKDKTKRRSEPKSTPKNKVEYSDTLQAYHLGNYDLAAQLLLQMNEKQSPDCMMLGVRIKANQGKLKEALLLCNNLIDIHKLLPEAYYLKATIESEMGNQDLAKKSIQNALFLNPNFIIAHFTLGNIALNDKQQDQSNRNFQNAINSLQKMKDEDIVPESDGMTVKRLKEIISSYLTKETS